MEIGKPVSQPFDSTLIKRRDIDTNSLGTGAPGAIPIWDGWKFIWSARNVFTPNLGKTAIQLRGTPPSILSEQHRTWITALKDHREANCPLARRTTYYFANAGNDTTGDGSQALPWQTVARCNAVLSPLSGNRVANNAHTVASSTPFVLNGRSWWMGGFISNNAGYYGSLFGIEGSYYFCSGLAANTTPGFVAWIGGSAQEKAGVTSTGAGAGWNYVEAWFDHTTRTLRICVNCGEVATHTLSAQLDASAQPFKVGANTGVSYTGDAARFFYVRDVVPTEVQRLSMYNGRKGWRAYTLPATLKAIFTSNAGSFWNLNGVNGTTTYADGISGRTLTRAVPQNPVVITGPDADAAASSTAGGVITGGANIACLFKREDRFADAGLRPLRANVTVADYSTGRKPVLSLFSIPISNAWTLVSGTQYKQICSAVSWVKKVGDDYLPFSLVLAKAGSAVGCGATANSFFYDTGAGELHINVGADPSGVSPLGWEGTVRGTTQTHVITGNFQRVQNLIFLGSGITEPGNASGYGLLVLGNVAEEHVLVNVDVFYTGYHAVGHISTKSIATWVGCRAGLCENRNEGNTTGQAANGTVYVSFCGSGDQELVMWDCEVTHGTLPSYDWTGNAGMGGVLMHTAGISYPALCLSYRTVYATTEHPCGYGTTFGTAESFTWSGQRAWVIEEKIKTPYRCGFSIPDRGDAGGGNWSSVVISGYDADLPMLGSAGYLLGGRGFWLLNSTFDVDCSGFSGTFNLLGNVASNTTYVALGCRFSVTNTNGAGVVRIGDTFAVGTIAGPWTNTVITCGGTVVAALGAAPSNMFANCAFFGMAAVGSNPVSLSTNPSLTAVDSQLIGVGSVAVEYDAANKTRLTPPSIGPWE